ncbi:uncharacterized protein Dwil_GK26932 [Drosophila willistoni]|uniref:larval cuticle protein III/IV n=1 Tax=Drosophila willistoni TaxID=7260 RepID=UPI0007329A43|nr:larval cuticle protein III/IV [Drosophila willistoni]KRF97939.1 uncharacterized protein Dwil_GK26932 [Drosophila willistoni]
MFKYILIGAILALAISNSMQDEAQIVKQVVDINPESYNWSFETSDGTSQSASGDEHGSKGSASWLSPEGEHVQIQYVADENGYQPQSALLPVAPPVPEAIQRALAYIAAHPSADAHN